ncbi:MAG: PrsW family glutamic-type intramembrane protease [Candidatus Paceibacterota bacterium]
MSAVELIATIGLGLLPSLTWMVFYLQEDNKHPEPLGMVFYAFVVGGLMTFLALVLQIVFRGALGSALGANHPFELFLFAVVEELIKFGAVYWFISSRKEFDEPLDAMIYMVVVGLGFAAVENIASLGQTTTSLITGINQIAKLEILALRFFGATLLHSLTGAIVGSHWGKAIEKWREVSKGIFTGLFIAILLHVIFNYLILITGPIAWVISFLVFVGFFVISDFEDLRAHDA